MIISPSDLLLVKTKLAQLESQQQQNTTMAAAVLHYESFIKKQHDLNLPPHAFLTANSVVDPLTGTVLEYKDFKLGPAAKLLIRGFSNEVGRLAQGVRPQILTGSNTIHFIHPSAKPVDR